jgi:GTP-binding protein
MQRFIDEADITIRSGDGGPGIVTFRREKYVPKGGPDGGDGGDGGDIIFKVDKNLRSLYDVKLRRSFKAQNGKPGGSQNKNGAKGTNCIIHVPPGTVVLTKESKKVLFDLTEQDEGKVLLKGGKGGHGNAYFASSINRTPRYAQKGIPGEGMELTLQIKTIADVGLVGLPNAGKSTLLAVLTDARPRIGDYPFTTLTPNLGVMIYKNERQFIIADIPGLIEGAHSGHGLGIRFLKHIERTKVLLFLIDLSQMDFSTQFATLRNELSRYSLSLLEKPAVLVGSKRDIVSKLEAEEFLQMSTNKKKLCISSIQRTGLNELKDEIVLLMEKYNEG